MKAVPRLWFFVACYSLLAFWGCRSRNEPGQTAGPGKYLYLTADLPAGLYWQARVDFKTTRDNRLCKSFSIVTGNAEASTESSQHELRKSGDTLKIPLFLNKPQLCGWEMTYVSFSLEGRCLTMPSPSVKSDSGKGPFGPLTRMPDTVAYIDSAIGSNGCLEFRIASGTQPDYFLDKNRAINRLHLQLRLR